MVTKAAEKRKAEDQAAEPPKKESKKEESAAEKEGETEPPKEEEIEKETDAPKDKRPEIKEKVGFNAVDTTLNVVPSMGDTLLTAMSEGGLQYLIAGARANVGVKAGRYMYEVKILEVLNPPEMHGSRTRPPMPRQLIRIGFSTAGSPLVLGDSEDHVCFDSEGFFTSGKTKSQLAPRITREQVIAIVLNLDAKSPNHNTISLFRDGKRVTKPQPLPEGLHGKTLFPHISFRNVTVRVMMGPQPSKKLPFTCRTVQGAAQPDAEVSKSKAGPCDVLFPVAFPDEGTFDWVDSFLEKNPNYVELSDRKIMDWALSSGLWRQQAKPWKSSNDKPDFNFGLPSMDDGSIRNAVYNIAPIVPRNYIIMEVKSNLCADGRKEYVERFRGRHFNKLACVIMGEPPEDFKKPQWDKMLVMKQEKEDAAHKARVAQKKINMLKQKQLADVKKKKQAAISAKEAERTVMDVDEANDGEDATKKEKKEEDDDTTPPKAELTEEEKKTWFAPKSPTDLTTTALNQAFGNFSIPKKDEGFDDVRFEWQDEENSNAYLRKWVLDRKVTTRIEDLQPSQWFHDRYKDWQKLFAEFQAKQEQKKEKPEEVVDVDDVEQPLAEKEKIASVDITAVSDVCDIGNGEPLFKDFGFTDWALLQLRYELFLLQAAFKRDVDDADRPGIHEDHFIFYYSKYFQKQLNTTSWGVESNAELVTLVADTVEFNDAKILVTSLEEDIDLEMLVKFTETQRRQRQRRIDAGDETARLTITPQAMQAIAVGRSVAPPSQAGSWQNAPMHYGQQWSNSAGKGGQSYQTAGFRPAGLMSGNKDGSGKGWRRSW